MATHATSTDRNQHPLREVAPVLLLAAAATALAWLVFRWLPPAQVLVGTKPIDAWTPIQYQLSVFPAFGAFVSTTAMACFRGDRAASWGRLGLLGGVLAIALVRLAGAIGLSGHAVCLAALVAEGTVQWRRPEAPWTVALAAFGLVVTGWYKLAVWGDTTWFAWSVGLGVALGLGCGLAPACRRR